MTKLYSCALASQEHTGLCHVIQSGKEVCPDKVWSKRVKANEGDKRIKEKSHWANFQGYYKEAHNHSLLSSSKSSFEFPLLLCTGIASGTLRTSFEEMGDGFISVKVVSSLSNSSLPSSR